MIRFPKRSMKIPMRGTRKNPGAISTAEEASRRLLLTGILTQGAVPTGGDGVGAEALFGQFGSILQKHYGNAGFQKRKCQDSPVDPGQLQDLLQWQHG